MTHIEETCLQQATIALLFATLRALGPANQTSSLEDFFEEHAKSCGFNTSSDLSLQEKLCSFLNYLETQPLGQPGATLAAAVHESISALVQNKRFAEAVETASRQQVYDLAYGLTHEINNPLANIAARAQQLISSVSKEADKKSLATIVDQSMRAYEMLAEMMHVAKPRSLPLATVDLQAVVERSVQAVEGLIKSAAVVLQMHPMTERFFVTSHAESLEESVVALLTNSIEACRPMDRIDLFISRISMTEPKGGENQTRIQLEIRDTGKGMSPESVERAFHLYFSGRESGRGLGISLAKVRRTIESSGGKVWMQSHLNIGTIVSIQLPAATPPPPRRKLVLPKNRTS